MKIIVPAHSPSERNSTWDSIFPGISNATADAPVTYISTIDASLKVELYLSYNGSKETLYFKMYGNNHPVSAVFQNIERSSSQINNVTMFTEWTIMEELAILSCNLLIVQPTGYGSANGGGIIATDGTYYIGYCRGSGSSSTGYGGLYQEGVGGYGTFTLQPAESAAATSKPDGSTNFLITKKYQDVDGEWVEFPLSVCITSSHPYVLSGENFYMANKGIFHVEIIR